MRKLVLVCVVVMLSGCFSLFNPWSSGKKDDPNVNTIGGRVFKTGTTTLAKMDTVLDVDPKLAHEEQLRGTWSVGNNLTTNNIAGNGFTFKIRQKRVNESLATFLVHEYSIDKDQARALQEGELFGIKGVMLDRVIGSKFQSSKLVAIEHGRCFYSLYVYAWGADGRNGDYRMLWDEARAGIRGTTGPMPVPAICK